MEPPPLFRAPPRISPPFSFAPPPSTHRYPLPFRPPRAPQGFVPAPGPGPGFHSAMGPGLLASPNALGDIPPIFNPTGPSPPTSLPLVAPSVGFYPSPPSFPWHTPPSGTQHPTVPRGFNTGPPAYHEVNQDDRFIAEWLREVETNRKHQQEQGTTAMKASTQSHDCMYNVCTYMYIAYAHVHIFVYMLQIVMALHVLTVVEKGSVYVLYNVCVPCGEGKCAR